MNTDRNLLFGVLALQADLIDPARFAEICTAWSARKETSLADLLVERGWLTAGDRADVEKLLARKLDKHRGDARAGLAEVTSDHVRHSLAGLHDTDVRASLAGVPLPSPGHVLLTTIDHASDSRGRYTLSRLHATGGIGRVWLARDQSIGRDVALKELLPERANRRALWTRFLMEAQITGQLEHPGIVPIYEVGRRDDDQPFYTMRFVRGRTLMEAAEDYHRKRRLGAVSPLHLRELLTAFVGVCNAVGYAHSRGVLHRDLKPQNVILGDFGEVMVLDWGLARLFNQPEVDETAPTRIETGGDVAATMQGQALGTPAYMAPEQAEGRVDLFGPRTDVYGLGAILFEILTGQPPFNGDDSTSLLRQVVHSAPPSPRSLVPQLPKALEAVCLKALAKLPAGRYDSAKALAADVTRWMADEPVSAWREPVRVRAGRWVRKHRTAVATALAALSVAVVGLLAVAGVQAESRRRLADSNHQLEAANRDLSESRDREAEAASHLAQTNRQLESVNASLAKARDRAERRVGLALAAVEKFQNAVDGNLDVKNRPENEALRKTLLQAPLAFFQRLRDDLREGNEATPEDRSRLAEAYFQLARLDRDIASQADALKAYDEAVALLEPLSRDVPATQQAGLRERLARALADRGELQSVSRDLKAAAADSFRRARELLEARVREQPGDAAARVLLARVLDGTADLQASKGEVDAALATLRASLAVLDQSPRDPDDVEAGLLQARTQLQISKLLLNRRSRLSEARTAAEAALRIAGQLVRARPDDLRCQRRLWEAYARVAAVHKAGGEVEKSLEVYGKQLAAVEDAVKAQPTANGYKFERVFALMDVASTLNDLGRNAEGLATFRKAREQAEGLVRDNPTNTEFKKALSATWSRTASPLYATGRVAEALSAIEKGAAVLEEVIRSDPQDVVALRDAAGAHYNIGLLNTSLGHAEAGLAAYAKALELREKLAREHPDDPTYTHDVAATLGNIAAVHFRARRHEEALPLYRREVETLIRLTGAHPDNAQYVNYLVRSRQNLASTLTQLGQYDEALDLLRAAREPCERMAREHPGVVLYQEALAHSLEQFATTYRRAGRVDEAVAAYQKVIDYREKLYKDHPDEGENRDKLVTALKLQGVAEQARGHFAAAAKDFRHALEVHTSKPGTSPEYLYDLACYHARLGTVGGKPDSGLSASEGRAEDDKAIDLLRRAFAGGYHNAKAMEADDDLASLRGRDDFRKLLAEMAAKAKPAGK